MKIQPVKGTRDFYPPQMRIRNYIRDAWSRVSLRNGFEEYDAPIFEYLDLFTTKSGPEIAEQLFNFTDRGGRNLAIRPEITPSLARMVGAKINSLAKPIKWFSIPRLCRAENPQKGRLREFFQWNIDIIGAENQALADAECILTCVDFLREMGLTKDDVKVRIGSRPLVISMLKKIGIGAEILDKALLALDKKPKIPAEAFEKMCKDIGITDEQIEKICEFLNTPHAQIISAGQGGDDENARSDLSRLWGYLKNFGVADYCVLDMHIVRGLAYYTGIVYEVFDAESNLRAVAGGGRYDNLIEVLSGPKVSATGFAMGDVVLEILLREKGKISDEIEKGRLDYFVICGEEKLFDKVLETVSHLRSQGWSADFACKFNVGKQLKQADRRGANNAIIIGENDTAIVKDMKTGDQRDVKIDDFLADISGTVV